MIIGLTYYRYPLFENGSYIQELVDSLSRKADKVVLIASKYPNDKFIKPSNLKIIWVPNPNIPILGPLLFNFSVLLTCLFTEFRNVDVVNTISVRGTIPAYVTSKILRKPVIATVEIINNPKLGIVDKFSYQVQKFVFSLKFDGIISWSEYYKTKYLLNWSKQSNISVVPAGVDTDKFSPSIHGDQIRKDFPKDSTLIVFAKPMFSYNRKMAELLIKSISKSKFKDNIYLLLGSGEEQSKILKQVNEFNNRFGSRISFLPKLPISEIPKYLSASDIIVLPYNYDPTTSRSLIEALSAGKAVVTTNRGEIPFILTNEVHALIVKPSPKEIADSIDRLISQPRLRHRLEIAARNVSLEKFSVESVASQTIEIYKRTLRAT